ncbi:MAG: spore germination protein [Clostridia bacterium]|nr:spore germination protein [Clostridia bacterium]
MDSQKQKGFLSQLRNILTYRPPKQNAFVLPELEDEGNEGNSEKTNKGDIGDKSNSDKNNKNESSSVQSKKSKKNTKKPIRASEWKQIKSEDKETKDKISANINVNLKVIKEKFHVPENIDVIIREFKLAQKVNAFIVFIDGMVNNEVINNFILRQLLNPLQFNGYTSGCINQYVREHVLAVGQTKVIDKYSDVVKQVLTGVTVLFIDGCNNCLAIETRGYEKRNIGNPVTENVVRGSQEAFTENTKTSIVQIRRLIKNEDLIHETIAINSTDNPMASIMYIKGIVNPKVVEEVKRRIKSIKTDLILGEGILAQFIEDRPFMLFPQVLATERPDRAASHILEGKVLIFSEGSPFALIVPVNFLALLHSPEDSSLRWQLGSFLRLIRLTGLLIALFIPSLYVAITNYHHEMLPTELLLAITSSRENIPFPTIVEALLMEVSFEFIREAGIRMPGLIGSTLGIIGALILGQAAVEANIVSPIMIIIVSITGLGNFTIPNYSLAFGIRLLRFFFICMAGISGFLGISIGFIIIIALSTSMKSFGVPFMSPGWPRTKKSADSIIRYPLWKQEKRPDAINSLHRQRQPQVSRGWVVDSNPNNKGGNKNDSGR